MVTYALTLLTMGSTLRRKAPPDKLLQLSCGVVKLLFFIINIRAARSVDLGVDGAALALNQQDLLQSLRNPAISSIALVTPFALTPDVFYPGAVTLNRTVTILAEYPQLNSAVIDLGQIPRGAIVCYTAECVLRIQGPGITFKNHSYSAYDFAPFLPSPITVGGNATTIGSDYTIQLDTPATIWFSNSLIYTAPFWVGDLKLQCPSSSQMVVQEWNSTQRSRDLFLQPSLPSYSTGAIVTQNVRMTLSPSYVCNSTTWTAATCELISKACNSTFAVPPALPASSCSPAGLAATCAPPPPAPLAPPLPVTAFSPSGLASPPLPDQSAPTSGNSLWWVGLAVGLPLGLGALLVAAAGVRFYHHHHQQQRLDQQQQFAGEVVKADVKHSSISVATLGGARDTTGSHGAPSNGSAYASGPTSLDMSRPKDTPHVKLASSAEDTANGKAPTYRVFSHVSHSNVNDLRPSSTTSSSQAGQTSKDSQVPVVGMPPSTSGQQPQLAGNPLELVLGNMLGFGAFGSVYVGQWRGEQVAVKIMKHLVNDQEELETVMQLREAALGAELDHPRIVKTLAYALIIPEDSCSEDCKLLKPAIMEAHVVSQLCDRGTLREWVQVATRAAALRKRGPGSVTSVLSQPVAGSGAAALTPAGPPPSPAAGTLEGHAARPGLLDPPASLSGTAGHVEGPPTLAKATTATAAAAGPAASAGAAAEVAADAARVKPDGGLGAHSGTILALTMGGPEVVAASRPGSHESDAEPGSAGAAAAVPAGAEGTQGCAGELPLPLFPPLACLESADQLMGTGVHCHFHWHLLAVVDILDEIAQGLAYLMSRGVIHGDVKLQNCLTYSAPGTQRGFAVRICDFGLSRILQGNKSHTTVTQPPGTLAYLAPELLTSCRMSPDCDVYGLGIVMWELLCLRQPFNTLTAGQIMFAKAKGAIDEFLPFPPETPPAFIQLARQCWHISPSQRPSLQEIVQRLAAVRQGVSGQPCAVCAGQPTYQ